ncbi:unnamed protein product [Gordionus sp. m RMFG-2023]
MSAKILRKLKLALIQLNISDNKLDNFKKVANYVKEAARSGSALIILPEFCCNPYSNTYYKNHGEAIPGNLFYFLSDVAKQNKVFLVAGSIPEKYNGYFYATSLAFNLNGQLLAQFRKIHLFDVNIPNKLIFNESSKIKSGNQIVTFNMYNIKIGLGRCYDLRFPEMAILYRKLGCHLLLYPSAFSYVTGPPHWELLLRARALDNQVYCAGVSSAADNNPAGHTTFGHSLVTDPWGKVIAKTDEKESILYSEIDMDYLEEVRQQMPLSNQKRGDLYSLEYYDVADPEAPFYSIP